jgi:hypothetical protein
MIKKLVLVLVGLGVGLIGCELLLRLLIPKTSFVTGFDYEIDLSSELFVRDPDFGVRPRVGTSLYDDCGTKVVEGRDSTAKTPGKRRILFMGDSVTFRGEITAALREHFGDRRFAYWNAGVESFNTSQEVLYYKRFNHLMKPDHVILTFHHNDFAATPAVFRESGKQLFVVFSNRSLAMNTWLHGKSYLYRLWFEWRVEDLVQQSLEKEAPTVRDSLRELRDMLGAEGIQLTVLVLPLCKPPDHWSDLDRATHSRALSILRELRIRHIDLLPALESAVKKGIELQENPGDTWHPSRRLGQSFVGYVAANGFTL